MDFKVEEYKSDYRIFFEQLNKAWLEEYFSVEPLDKWVLENPEEAILRDGGKIYFVEYHGSVIGTVALKRMENNEYEMTKMAVDKQYLRIGVGQFICSTAINKAKEELEATRLVLYSHTSLTPAIALYKKLGFGEIPLETGKYERADIKMEVIL